MHGSMDIELHEKVMKLIYEKPAIEIASELGMSRERVRAIINRNGGYKDGMVRGMPGRKKGVHVGPYKK